MKTELAAVSTGSNTLRISISQCPDRHFCGTLISHRGIPMNRIRSLRFLLLPLLLAWLASAYADGAGPALGAAAPDFKLQDQNGKWHELKDYRGKWVALYFYPKDQTPGCTTQACEFRD